MATAGPSAPGTTADDNAVGVHAWSNTGNAVSSNNVYATVVGDTVLADTHYLKCTNFGFAIPSGATINGVTVAIERKASANTTTTRYIRDSVIKLVKGGTVSGSNYAVTGTNWTTTDSTPTYGGAADLWGLTLSDTDVNASTFGVVLSVNTVHNITGTTASVDLITITIDYTAGGGGGGLSIPVAMNSYRQRRV